MIDLGMEYKLLRHAFSLELEYEITNKIPLTLNGFNSPKLVSIE